MINFYFITINFIKNIFQLSILQFLIKIYTYIILTKFRKGQKKFIFVYDLKVSPLAYGEICLQLFFLRILYLLKNKIEIILINSEIRKDVSNRYSKKIILNLLKFEIPKMTKFIVSRSTKINYMSWDKFNDTILPKYEKNILFLNLIIRRKPVYQLTHNIGNLLFPEIEKKNKNKFYLKFPKTFYKFKKKFPNKFITIGIRYGYENEKNRNIKILDLKKILNYLLYKYKKHKIIICSNKDTYRKISKIIVNKNIIFSKKFSKDFFEDSLIILKSKFFFQYGGSGISQFAEHSKIPFQIIKDFDYLKKIRSDFLTYNKNKKHSWQRSNQKYYNIINYKM
tara:strand:- start:129 stop:1142 length:1014 start_codon:yes stop_codon:yes gene_type:complete